MTEDRFGTRLRVIAFMAKRKDRAIDQAREWRERALAEYDALRALQPVPGLTKHPNERSFYLRLRPGESAGQQLNVVFKKWNEICGQYGERGLVGISSGGWTIVPSSGEQFCGVRVARFHACMGETDEQFVPMVEAAETHLRELAAAKGWLLATIEGGDTFECNDGRRFPLAACTCRQLTDEDYNAHRRKPKRPAD